MKKAFIPYLLLTVAVAMHAAPIGRNAALQTARQFLADKGLERTIAVQQPSRHAAPATDERQDGYHLFQFDNNGGFIIMSADDRLPAVLAYADRGRFVVDDDMPQGLRDWLTGIESLTRSLADETVTRAADDMPELPQHEPVEPMLTSRWYQLWPYNMTLPDCHYTDKQGQDSIGQCATGCGPTAFAQLLYYHRWPKTLAADIAGYRNPGEDGGIAQDLPVIPAGTPIRWNDMLDTYYLRPTFGTDPLEAQTAVSELMMMCAQSIHSSFGRNTSSQVEDMVNALKTCFGYDDGVRYADRLDYTFQTWDELIYGELSAHRPVLYSGHSLVSGHAFVVDGTDGTGLYHVNWGWSGVDDGYFLLMVLNPDDKSGHDAEVSFSGFGFRQSALVGVQPPQGANAISTVTADTPHPDDRIYTIDGRPVRPSSPLRHGVYIRQGRKFVVK